MPLTEFPCMLRSADGESAVLHDLGGAGPAALFTHGNGLNAGMWATVVSKLRDRLHCYGLDFRGHGASRPTSEDFSLDRSYFVQEILAAVDELGPPVLGVGHSLGGAMLALAELAAPGTFRGLWLFEPVLIPAELQRPEGPSQLSAAAARRRIDFDSVEDAVERFRSKPPFSGCELAAVQAYVELGTVGRPEGGVRLSCLGTTESRVYDSGAGTDFALLQQIRCPVTVAYGSRIASGNDLPPLVAPQIAEAVPNGHLEAFEGLTHFAPMENGAAVAASVRAFSAGLT